MSARRRRVHPWIHYDDESLLDTRFCDLRLALNDSAVTPLLAKVCAELAARGLKFRPHCWLAEEWFTPDGVPGFAIPFYLAHPRLARLERRMMREVEGGNRNWCLRILRHEAAHAIDNAFRLRRRADWRKVFGSPAIPYPTAYRPRPGSRRYVQHLGLWYAQSHPTEDFAETFAVWLKPQSTWRQDYADWPAIKKLQYVDALMESLRRCAPPVRTRMHVEPLGASKRTLREHYAERLAAVVPATHRHEDRLLLRVFTAEPARPRLRAGTLLRRNRARFHRVVAAHRPWRDYLIHQVMRAAIRRCDELQLYVQGDVRRTVKHAERILIGLAKAFETSVRRRVSL
jgi:hypothetical protein